MNKKFLLTIFLAGLILIIGANLWGVCYYFGVITFPCALLSTFFALFIFDKMWKLEKKTYIIIGTSSIILNLLAWLHSTLLIIMSSIKCTYLQSFKLFGEVTRGLITEVIITNLISMAVTIAVIFIYKYVKDKKVNIG